MKKLFLILALCVVVPALWGQQPERRQKGTPSEGFRKFREKMLNDYSEYRTRVLENYDKFLEGTWSEMAAFPGEEYPSEPKPKEVPRAPKGLDLDPPCVIPQPKMVRPMPIVAPEPEYEKVPDVTMPESKFPKIEPNMGKTPTISPIERPKPEYPEENVQPEASEKPQAPVEPASSDVSLGKYPGGAQFDFYGMSFSLPAPKVNLLASLNSPKDYADQWRNLVNARYADEVVPAVKDLVNRTGLNDYFLIELLQGYAKAAYPAVSAASRAGVVHFILNNMGYDARIGKNDKDAALLLIPIVQNRMYERSFIPQDGKNYYVFPDDAHSLKDIGYYWTVCKLPENAEAGRSFNLRIDGMKMPMKAHDFDVEFGGLRLKGAVNENLMKMVYRYPLMEMGEYAASNIMPELRSDLVKQVREQLQGKSQLDAVNTLLRFVQKGFEYATDDVLHGREKPYFMEEVFYQPKCDCEDRAIFFSYLLWNALGVENHLINYPGHEATAVTLQTDIEGDSYEYDGKKFLISDPTFIGATTGRSMPCYKTTSPEIDYIYSREQ